MSFQYSDTIIGNDRIDLIPYRSEHVKIYNNWLQSTELQELTETEPCTLEEEFSYQKEWETDNQKTKLIKLIKIKSNDSESILIGDVNLFFCEQEAEINIMISDPQYRGKGIAKEVLVLIISYLKSSDRCFKKIVAKVLSKNVSSLRFFEKFGFIRETENVSIFNEITLNYSL